MNLINKELGMNKSEVNCGIDGRKKELIDEDDDDDDDWEGVERTSWRGFLALLWRMLVL